MTTGGLVVVGTPIGNLEDLSPRAAAALAGADVVAAEDTRRTGLLLDHVRARGFAGRPRLVSYHEHNEVARTPELAERMAGGETVALVTDAGTPGVADPGYRLVRAAVDAGVRVESVPGPAAVLQALVVSGLPTDRFAFEGFLPRRAGPRSRQLAELAGDRRTLVFYLAPHRAADELDALVEAFGADRPAALARELTKRYEEVWRGGLGDLAERAARGVKGELTLVVGGAPREQALPEPAELAARVQAVVAAGRPKKEAIAEVARVSGVPKREVYQAVLDAGT